MWKDSKDKDCICGCDKYLHMMLLKNGQYGTVNCVGCNCLEYKESKIPDSVDNTLNKIKKMEALRTIKKNTCCICGIEKDLGYNNLYELICLKCHNWLEEFAEKYNNFNEIKSKHWLNTQIYKTLGIKDTRDADMMKELGIQYV